MKRLITILLCMVIALTPLTGCLERSNEEGLGNVEVPARSDNGTQSGSNSGVDALDPRNTGTYDGPPGTWAIYWYLCGTDLESLHGLATVDINEMFKVTLPPNVTVVIQTGGTRQWRNDAFSSDSLERYVYAGSTLTKVDAQPLASMGDPDTLADFLEFCNLNYPAERQGLILWDHGGGSLFGIQVDELFGNDIISLPELQVAIEAAPAASGMYEFVGMDACLMATVDVVTTLIGKARYFIASEELEPGIGWEYTGLFSALAADTTMSGGELGKAICDSFYAACAAYKMEKEVTLSVIDLSLAEALVKAYDAVGIEALQRAAEDGESFLSAFGRAAYDSEAYGDRNYEMVDLGHLVKNALDILPKSGAALLAALEACVYYNVYGEFRSNASGLACYYPFSGDIRYFSRFETLNTSRAFKYLYEYALTGAMSGAAQAYLTELEAQGQAGSLVPTGGMGFEGHPVYVGGDGRWHLDLGPELASKLAAVFVNVIWVNPATREEIQWGANLDLTTDWARGVFIEDFRDEWGSIDSVNIHMEPVAIGYNRILYRVPIFLNGERCALSVGYSDGKYEILSVMFEGDFQTRLAGKNMRRLAPGDVIEPIHPQLVANRDGTFDLIDTAIHKIVVNENTSFSRRELGSGYFKLRYQMIDYAGNIYYSNMCLIRILNDEILRVADGQLPEPEGSDGVGIEVMDLRKNVWFNPETGRDVDIFTAELTPEGYALIAGLLDVDPSGDSGTRTYTVQLHCYEIFDLNDYVGVKNVFIEGTYYTNRHVEELYGLSYPEEQYDIIFVVKDLLVMW